MTPLEKFFVSPNMLRWTTALADSDVNGDFSARKRLGIEYSGNLESRIASIFVTIGYYLFSCSSENYNNIDTEDAVHHINMFLHIINAYAGVISKQDAAVMLVIQVANRFLLSQNLIGRWHDYNLFERMMQPYFISMIVIMTTAFLVDYRFSQNGLAKNELQALKRFDAATIIRGKSQDLEKFKKLHINS